MIKRESTQEREREREREKESKKKIETTRDRKKPRKKSMKKREREERGRERKISAPYRNPNEESSRQNDWARARVSLIKLLRLSSLSMPFATPPFPGGCSRA